jgi:NTE family protein
VAVATSAPARHERRPHTAFVLAGGASLGALQAGMLHALYERGIKADLLVGTSVGALNAAFVASRPQTPATARELARVWRGVEREDAFPVSLRTLVGGLSGQRDHLVPTRGLRRIVQRHVQLQDLADAATPLHVVAFDIAAADEAVLSEGPALDAIVAACSIMDVQPTDFDHSSRLVAEAYAAARKALARVAGAGRPLVPAAPALRAVAAAP